MSVLVLVPPLIINFSVLVAVTYLVTRFQPFFFSPRSPLVVRLACGLGFAAVALFLIALGWVSPEGIRIDFRGVPILMAGLAGGPLSGTLTGFLVGLGRWELGGLEATAGLVAAIAGGLLAGLYGRWFGLTTEIMKGWHVLVLGTLSAVIVPVAILLTVPYPANLLWAYRAFPPYLAANTGGLAVVLWIIRDNAAAHRYTLRLRHQATTDAMTGLANYRRFKEFLGTLLPACAAGERTVSLIMIDVDDFKEYNDRFGHPAGDRALEALGRLLVEGVRRRDLVARYGGEEFAVVLPDSSLEEALDTAERLRQVVAAYPFGHQPITFCSGVSSFPDPAPTEQALVEQADQALYRAKSQGRNRVARYFERDAAERRATATNESASWPGP